MVAAVSPIPPGEEQAGEVVRLKTEIARLNTLATEAYRRRDLATEASLDKQAEPLKQRLRELTWKKCPKCNELYPPDQIDEKGFCYTDSDKSVHPTHRYDPKIFDPNQRCSRCGVKQYHGQAHWPCPGRSESETLTKPNQI